MRIIAGRFRGRVLRAPGGQATRPTTDRVRESLFSILTSRFDFSDAHVLDLFAGSGALGFEALSRGAATTVFVEKNRSTCDCIRENAEKLGVADAVTIICRQAQKYLGGSGGRRSFDFVFADPPYGTDVASLPIAIEPFFRDAGVFSLEHDGANSFEQIRGHVLTRAFGRTHVSVFEYA